MSAERVVSRRSTPIKLESTPWPETKAVKHEAEALPDPGATSKVLSKYFTLGKVKKDNERLKSELGDSLKNEHDGAGATEFGWKKEEDILLQRGDQDLLPEQNGAAEARADIADVIDLVSEDEDIGSTAGGSSNPVRRPTSEPSPTGKRKTRSTSDLPKRTRGQRRAAVVQVESSDQDSEELEEASGPTPKRPKAKKQRLKRGYAPPEVYAHLNYVQDCLDYELNILFCGINPGQKSAGEGHHFANPRNGFWKCLHQGGLTDTLVPPSEDHTLPQRFRLGIINLIDRPSAEMAELSMAERRAAVPGFLRKVHKWRPKIVCMVGKGIWEDVFAYVAKASKGKPKDDGISIERCTDASSSGQRDWSKLKAKFEYDVQPVCLLHDLDKGDGSKAKNGMAGTTTIGAGIRRTLFFVVPSTSGRVMSHQLSDKVVLFQLLRKRWEELEAGRMAKSVEWQIRIN